jgi:hypothetical protein
MWIKNITPGRNEIIQPKTVVFSEPDAATFKAARLPFWVEIPRGDVHDSSFLFTFTEGSHSQCCLKTTLLVKGEDTPIRVHTPQG